ncbi:nucleotidyltransferase family protein [Chloroflexota bacterium]
MNDQTAGDKLLRCLRLEEERHKNTALADFSEADWRSIFDLAKRHDLIPYLYWRLENLSAFQNIPTEQRTEMRTLLMTSAQRNTRLLHRLGKVITALGQAGIPVITLKGAHLAEWVYADPALRPMGDIDLLVRLDDLLPAIQVLTELGYHSSRRYQIAKERQSHHHLPPYSHPQAASIEIHWSTVMPGLPLRVDIQGLWDRSAPSETGGSPCRALSPDDLLIHLCTHLCQHEFSLGLKALLDIGLVLWHYREDLNWDQITQTAGQWQAAKCIYLSLYLAGQMLAAPLPPEALQALCPLDFSPEIANLAQQRLTGFAIPAPIHPDLARAWSKQRSLSSRLRSLSANLLPPPEYIAGRYALPPGSLRVYPYYLVRLKDLFVQYSGQLWRLLRRDQNTMTQTGRQNALVDWLLAP